MAAVPVSHGDAALSVGLKVSRPRSAGISTSDSSSAIEPFPTAPVLHHIPYTRVSCQENPRGKAMAIRAAVQGTQGTEERVDLRTMTILAFSATAGVLVEYYDFFIFGYA